MFVLFMTDVHDNLGSMFYVANSEVCDLILLGGDFFSFSNFSMMWDTLLLLRDLSKKEIFFVPGNWEPMEVLFWENLAGAFNLHGRMKSFGGYHFCGVGGAAPRRFFFPLEFDVDDMEYYILKLGGKILSEHVSVFISHMIPYDSLPLMKFIYRSKPDLVLCGHIHERKFIKRDNGMIVANPGAMYNGDYCMADISSGSVGFVNTSYLAHNLDSIIDNVVFYPKQINVSMIDLLYIVDNGYIRHYPKFSEIIGKLGAIDVLENNRRSNIYPVIAYRLAKINKKYFINIQKKEDILSTIIESKNPMASRWASRILGLFSSYKKRAKYVEALLNELSSTKDTNEINLTLMEILQISEQYSNYEGMRDIFDNLYNILDDASITDLFLLLSNIALSDQKFIKISEISDQLNDILQRESLESLGILFGSISRYASHNFLKSLAIGLKSIVKNKFKDSKEIEKMFFRRRIEGLLPRGSILTVTLSPIFDM